MSYYEIVEEVKRLSFPEQLRLMEELARVIQRQAPPLTEASAADQYLELMKSLRHVDAGRKYTREEMNERR